jgi:hypothetical protein
MATSPELEPLGFGGVLDAGFGTLRRGYWFFVVAILVATVPTALIDVLLIPPMAAHATASVLAQDVVADGPLRLLVALVGVLQSGAVIVLAAQVYRKGQPDVGLAYRQALRRFLPLLFTDILLFLGTAFASIFLVVPGLFIGVRWSLAPYIVVTEPVGPFQALGKSWRLVKGFWWRVLGLFLVTFIIIFVLDLLIEAPFGGGLVALFHASGGLTSLGAVGAASTIAASVASVLVGAFPTAVMFVQYTDLRVRKEGIDLAEEPPAV